MVRILHPYRYMHHTRINPTDSSHTHRMVQAGSAFPAEPRLWISELPIRLLAAQRCTFIPTFRISCCAALLGSTRLLHDSVCPLGVGSPRHDTRRVEQVRQLSWAANQTVREYYSTRWVAFTSCCGYRFVSLIQQAPGGVLDLNGVRWLSVIGC